MNYFYVLLSHQDNDHDYGSTTDLQKRVHEHVSGRVNSTRNRLPVRLVYYEAYETIDAARARERQVKASGSVRSSLLKRITRP